MKNLTWQNPEQLFVAQELINKVKSKCCGIKDQYIDKTYSEATKDGEIGWENSDINAPQYGQLKQEEHMIYRLYNQYSQPSINLNFTINLQDITPWSKMREKFMNGKDFIIDEFSIDYENASTNLSLIEKK